MDGWPVALAVATLFPFVAVFMGLNGSIPLFPTRLTALTELERVHGIGPVFAKELLDTHGIRTLTDLLTRKDLCVHVAHAVPLSLFHNFALPPLISPHGVVLLALTPCS